MTVINMADLDLAGKRVLIRQDLNVPVKRRRRSRRYAYQSLVTDDQALALAAGAKVMLMSHLGRPTEGVYDEAFSSGARRPTH